VEVNVYRFQVNDNPWRDEDVLAQDLAAKWSKLLRPFRGKLRLDSPGADPGPYRQRPDAIHRGVTAMTHGETGTVIFIANEAHKGVRCRSVVSLHPYGPIFPCTGPCKDDYPNMVIRHNAGGQLFKMQEPAALAYAEAERINGRPIRITGEAWRSCSQQSALYHSDPGRFANPDTSRHCRGLAMDVYNDSVNLNTKSRAALISVGFSAPVNGEPWHYCFGPNPG
jgi:hypothetical protein